MNIRPENQFSGFIQRIACANHRRDDQGWPLGNCIECEAYRKQMDAWHMSEVMQGNHRPGSEHRDATIDVQSEYREGWDWGEVKKQSGTNT